MASIEQITEQIQDLPPVDQLRLVDTILQNLEPIDPEVEKMWAAESDARYEAFKRGEIEATDWDAIKKDLGL